jgi:23S rRNA pseudouridine2605 synthase
MIQDFERLQKVLARQGIGARRTVEDWIRKGRLTVNGEIAYLGVRVNSQSKICLDGKQILLKQNLHTLPHQTLIYYKPAGEICTRQDPEGRPTVFNRLPLLQNQRWVSVGRLDFNTLGLLIFTTDGALANRLLHPRYEVERKYAVRVQGHVTPAILARLKAGVILEDGPAAFSVIKPISDTCYPQETQIAGKPLKALGINTHHWYHVTLKEGRHHEVKRLWASQGLSVSRLIRIQFGPIVLPSSLKPRQVMTLSSEAMQQLYAAVSL